MGLYQQETEEKIRLGFYPYTYVRVMTMKSKLYKKGDYDKILKMGFAEIAKFMQESEYKKVITEVSQQNPESGFDMLELALQKSLEHTLTKLRKISPEELQVLINAYLTRYDYENVKTIIRGKFAGIPKEEIQKLLISIGLLSKEQLKKYVEMDTIEKVLQTIPLLKKQKGKVQEALKHLKEKGSLLLIENVLDHTYFESMVAFTTRIPLEGKLFRDFLEYEIDVLNIKTILRLKALKLPGAKIKEHIFFSGKIFNRGQLHKFMQMDVETIIKELKKSRLKKAFSEKEQKEDMSGVELALDRFVLKTATTLLHQHPLSVDTIIGYLFAKDIEVKNLRTIIKAKQLDVPTEFIEKQLVIA
jgi:V/A-type H+/Na+-transporting ATPase subunit C